MGRGFEVEDLENLLPVQILVLCSLGVQLILFLFAGVRRRETSSSAWMVPVFFLWIAYSFGDTFATFALGRLSFTSDTGKHPLVALWAPFLLLHLAGPDNITAYALQDNELSLRSIQTSFAQVLAGGYFIYKYRKSSGHFIRLASRLMFAVGVVKYVERWFAVRRGNLGGIRDSVKEQAEDSPEKKKQPVFAMNYIHAHRQDVKLKKQERGLETLDEESTVRRAHSLFHVCKWGMVDSGMFYYSEELHLKQNILEKMKGVERWAIIEIELSLMYDILYTKAAMIHTWHGYTIRVISPLAILTSLLLFHFSEGGHREFDTATTYALFFTALLMELTSLLSTLGSSWMFAYLSTTRSTWLRYTFLCSGRWDRLRRLVASLSFLVTCGLSSRCGARRWSGHMGQYNMLHFCTRPNALYTRPLIGRLAKLVGLEELWNRKHFSGAINISDHDLIKECIDKHTRLLYEEGQLNTLGMITPKWGMQTLEYHKVVDKFEKTLGSEFQEGIIVWHIGTDFFLSKCNSGNASVGLVKAIKGLSNYMMFLLVERPYMLPGIAHNKLYERTCELLQVKRHRPTRLRPMLKCLLRWHDDPNAGSTSRAIDSNTQAKNLYNVYIRHKKFTLKTGRLTHSATVARQLQLYEVKNGTTKSLELLLDVWVDMLVYAGNKCSRESHAKKLSSGGELITIVWLLLEHYNQALLEYRASQEAASKEEYHDNNRV